MQELQSVSMRRHRQVRDVCVAVSCHACWVMTPCAGSVFDCYISFKCQIMLAGAIRLTLRLGACEKFGLETELGTGGRSKRSFSGVRKGNDVWPTPDLRNKPSSSSSADCAGLRKGGKGSHSSLKRDRLGEDLWFGWKGVLNDAWLENSSKSRFIAESKSTALSIRRLRGDGVRRRGCFRGGVADDRWEGEKAE